jgi:methylated-DNA-[protein]-cysteine S-methyltransferase
VRECSVFSDPVSSPNHRADLEPSHSPKTDTTLKSEISNPSRATARQPQGKSPAPTPFAAKVYAALRKIPSGRVITYAALARRIDCPSPRAIGQALRTNPFAPAVPCHRVIASDLTPGGFQGHHTGPALAKKLRLLAAEGVHFKSNHLADPTRAIR